MGMASVGMVFPGGGGGCQNLFRLDSAGAPFTQFHADMAHRAHAGGISRSSCFPPHVPPLAAGAQVFGQVKRGFGVEPFGNVEVAMAAVSAATLPPAPGLFSTTTG